jgi:hypothetical protein
MTDENDWRLTANHERLRGATLSRRRYEAPSASWEHDHCEFCWAKFMQRNGDGIQAAGYFHAGSKTWICDRCLDEFRDRFDWKTEPFNDESIRQTIEWMIAQEFPVDSERFELTVLSAQAGDWSDSGLSIEAAIRVKFLASGSPYCCGEPICHLRLFRRRGEKRLSELVTERLRLGRVIQIRLKEQVEYAEGVQFDGLS